MTQRLTPEREAEIRLAVKRQQLFGGHSEDLLAEIDFLRAELAGAEERGAARERIRILAYGRGTAEHQSVATLLSDIARDEHWRFAETGTTPPDAGEPGNG